VRNRAQQLWCSGYIARPSDRALPRRHVALATGRERAAHARLVHLPTRSEPPLPALGPQPLARAGGADAAAGAPPAEPRRLALHPSLRSLVARRRRPVLRRPADGRLVPAPLCAEAVPAQGHGRPLDAARADLGGGAGPQKRGRLQPVAEHGAALRRALALPTSQTPVL